MTASDVVIRFAEACTAGDTDALEELLAADVMLVSDGGGQVVAPLRPIRGAVDTGRLVARLLSARPSTVLTVEDVNGADGLVLRRAGRAEAVVGLEVAGSVVTDVWIVLNPDKLTRWHHAAPSRP